MAAKVSVIITIYNKIDYLERCINSIQASSYRELEIICVDDFSTDGSYELLAELKKHDQRIYLMQNEKNYGVSYARNRGMDRSTGKYIMFVDADDYLEKEAINTWIYEMEENCAEGCFIKMISAGVKGIEGLYKGVYDGMTLLSSFVKNNETFLYACGAIWRADFIKKNEITFCNLRIGEGGMFILQSMMKAKRIIVSNEPGYHYEVNSTSVSLGAQSMTYSAIGQAKQLIYMILQLQYDHPNPEILSFILWYLEKNIGGIKNIRGEDIRKFKEVLSDNEKFIFDLLRESKLDSSNSILAKDISVLKHFDSVALYGAGYETLDAIRICNDLELEIKGIFVTKGYPHPRSIYGYRVHEFDGNQSILDKNTPVLVTAHQKYHHEIEEIIKQAGIEKIFFMRKQ